MAKMMKLPNWKILDIHRALTALSQRRLETRDSVKKIVRLLRDHFDAAKKEIDDLANSAFEELPAPEGWEGENLPITIFEARQKKVNELHKEETEIPHIPSKLYIEDKDLPKLMKGEDGDKNQKGLGAILHDLHFLYPLNGEKPPVDGNDGDETTEE